MINFTKISFRELAAFIRPFIARYLVVMIVGIVTVGGLYSLQGKIGGLGLVCIGLGCISPALVWSNERQGGLPLTAMMGAQTLVIYGMPIVSQNDALGYFTEERVMQASVEILVFGVALAAGWWMIFNQIRPRQPRYYRAFSFLETDGNKRLTTVGGLLLLVGVAFQIANMQRWLGFLPGGAFSVIRAITDALGLAGGLVSAFLVGSGVSRGASMIRFWILYVVYSLLIISNYTLFPAASMLLSVSFGLFLGRGRLPVVFLVLVVTFLSVLNLAKFDMRRQYWQHGQAYADQRLEQLPSRYQQWIETGFSRLGGRQAEDDKNSNEQKLASRVDNLVILLRAQSFVLDLNYSVLGGETYWIIPPLFIPRIFWPDKPRTHEGMVILNVHFGQQTREESLVTYISWGLLPEAYANFGPYLGAGFLGLALGFALGWTEWWSRDLPLASFQSLVVLTFSINCATSFESVASVWLTSVFQMVIAMSIGLWAFTRPKRIDYSSE